MMIETSVIYNYPGNTSIAVNLEEESAEIKVEDGTLKLQSSYDNENNILPGIAIEMQCNNPTGAIYFTPEQLQELLDKFAEAAGGGTTVFKLVQR